jgi:RNase H-fold protein (predicted Holliday junction resolvase)
MVELDIEMIEEAISTIEADQIYKKNKRPKKKYKSKIDSIAAAVILRRAIV